MKISTELKKKDLSQKTLEHLSFLHVNDVKLSMFVIVLIGYDLFLLLSLLIIMKMEMFWILTPLIAIIHLWTLRLLVKNVYSTQFEAILFTGVYGIIGVITFHVLIHGISIYTLNISSIFYYIGMNFVMFIVYYFLVKYQIDTYSKDPTQEHVSKSPSKLSIAIYISAPGIGIIIASLIRDTFIIKHYVTLGLDFLMLFFHAYIAAKFIHRYFFIKANMDYVVFQEPNKKQKIQLMKKGVEIK